MNQSEFLLITSNSLKGREKSRVHGAIGFGFASHWLKNWRESFKPITKRSNRNHVITFNSHLKTALTREGSVSKSNCALKRRVFHENIHKFSLHHRKCRIKRFMINLKCLAGVGYLQSLFAHGCSHVLSVPRNPALTSLRVLWVANSPARCFV